MSDPFLITRAQVGGQVLDVSVVDGTIVAVAPDLSTRGRRVVDAAGGALLPGLHDHHLHLLAMAAGRRSIRLEALAGPAELDDAVNAAHRKADPGSWLRAVGLEDRHGHLDRSRLDRLAPGRPVRVQHRSGAAWVLSSAGLALIGRTDVDDGWLFRADAEPAWPLDVPDLAPVGARLARLGVTGVTDATPFTDPSSASVLAEACRRRDLVQRVAVTGAPAVAGIGAPDGLEQGPVKVVVGDHSLPDLTELVSWFRAARRAGRAVAVHCVTRVALVLALTAWEELGAEPGDRIEHGSVIPVELIGRLADLGLRVVTQPGFIADRGDTYLSDVEPDDLPHLYRCSSLLAAGVPVAGSTDAPFGPDDPWVAIATAIDRRTAAGATLGRAEAVSPEAALEMFLGPLDDPGGAPRRVERGAPADLCLLDVPLEDVLDDPSSGHVRATWIGGEAAY